MRKKVRGLILVAALIAAFVAGRRTTPLAPLVAVDTADPRRSSLAEQDAHFARVVADWNQYVRDHDGWLPPSHDEAFQSTEIDGLDELRRYDFDWIPPRLNPVLSLNPRWPVFSLPRSDADEAWVCYADGSWVRTALPIPRSDWSGTMRRGGYSPTANLLGDPWLAQNRSRLVWDPSLGIYALPKKWN